MSPLRIYPSIHAVHVSAVVEHSEHGDSHAVQLNVVVLVQPDGHL
jgi:hypothetical protein